MLLSCNIRFLFLKRIACLGSAMRPSKSGLHTVTIMPLSPAMQMLGAFAEFERAMCSENINGSNQQGEREIPGGHQVQDCRLALG